jgi:hypothetical protein
MQTHTSQIGDTLSGQPINTAIKLQVILVHLEKELELIVQKKV